jgi:hypothetical protein
LASDGVVHAAPDCAHGPQVLLKVFSQNTSGLNEQLKLLLDEGRAMRLTVASLGPQEEELKVLVASCG